jgi:hypothetical protein
LLRERRSNLRRLAEELQKASSQDDRAEAERAFVNAQAEYLTRAVVPRILDPILRLSLHSKLGEFIDQHGTVHLQRRGKRQILRLQRSRFSYDEPKRPGRRPLPSTTLAEVDRRLNMRKTDRAIAEQLTTMGMPISRTKVGQIRKHRPKTV